jgi:hypothetical protein
MTTADDIRDYFGRMDNRRKQGTMDGQCEGSKSNKDLPLIMNIRLILEGKKKN